MHELPQQVFRVLLLGMVLWGCGGCGLREGPVEGEVLSVGSGNVSIRLSKGGGWSAGESVLATALATEADELWLQRGQLVRGELMRMREGGGLVLGSVWPARPEDESQLASVNKRLRRDTVTRGQAAFREVGESLPEFALYDQDGRLLTHESLRGRWTVLHFIFTRCTVPEMCPASSMKMARMLEILKAQGAEQPLLLSFTLDPLHDTPGILKAYAQGYGMDHPQSRFLTGPLQVVQDLKKQLGILSRPHDTLLIQHTLRTVLAGPDLKIVHHVPHRTWDVEDFLEKMQGSTKLDPS